MEIWKPVSGEKGLDISNMGRVRRHYWRGKWLNEPMLCKLIVCRANSVLAYHLVWLPSQRLEQVHVLVAATFIGPRPQGMDICHNDGNGTNNRPDNLRYDTRAANLQESRAAKLTPDIVRAIRAEHNGRRSTRVIAERYNVTTECIRRVVARRSWKNI